MVTIGSWRNPTRKCQSWPLRWMNDGPPSEETLQNMKFFSSCLHQRVEALAMISISPLPHFRLWPPWPPPGLPPPILLHRRVGDFFKRFHRLSSTIRRSTQLKLKESINIDLVIGTTFWRAQGIGNWIFVGNRFVDLSIWQLERPLQLTATANRPAMISTSGVG